MRLALLVVAVLAAGCGNTTATCSGSGSFSICDSDEWSELPTQGTGTRLMVCDSGRASFVRCSAGCVANGGGSDVCR